MNQCHDGSGRLVILLLKPQAGECAVEDTFAESADGEELLEDYCVELEERIGEG